MKKQYVTASNSVEVKYVCFLLCNPERWRNVFLGVSTDDRVKYMEENTVMRFLLSTPFGTGWLFILSSGNKHLALARKCVDL